MILPNDAAKFAGSNWSTLALSISQASTPATPLPCTPQQTSLSPHMSPVLTTAMPAVSNDTEVECLGTATRVIDVAAKPTVPEKFVADDKDVLRQAVVAVDDCLGMTFFNRPCVLQCQSKCMSDLPGIGTALHHPLMKVL